MIHGRTVKPPRIGEDDIFSIIKKLKDDKEKKGNPRGYHSIPLPKDSPLPFTTVRDSAGRIIDMTRGPHPAKLRLREQLMSQGEKMLPQIKQSMADSIDAAPRIPIGGLRGRVGNTVSNTAYGRSLSDEPSTAGMEALKALSDWYRKVSGTRATRTWPGTPEYITNAVGYLGSSPIPGIGALARQLASEQFAKYNR